MKDEKFIETWAERSKISLNKDKNDIIISTQELKKIKVPIYQIAICDLCGEKIGTYLDIKHKIEPETVTKAINSGLILRGLALELLDMVDKDKKNKMIDFWKKMAISSETPWALCDDCFAEMEKVLNNKT